MAEKGQDGSACGHAAPRPSNAAVKRQRQFALGVGPQRQCKKYWAVGEWVSAEDELDGCEPSRRAPDTTDVFRPLLARASVVSAFRRTRHRSARVFGSVRLQADSGSFNR